MFNDHNGVANSTTLPVALQLFKLLRQLIYLIRSCACGPQPQKLTSCIW